MLTRLQQWDDDLALLIPDELAIALGFVDGGEVDLSIDAGRLVVSAGGSLRAGNDVNPVGRDNCAKGTP